MAARQAIYQDSAKLLAHALKEAPRVLWHSEQLGLCCRMSQQCWIDPGIFVGDDYFPNGSRGFDHPYVAPACSACFA